MGKTQQPTETAVEQMLDEWKRGMLTFWALSLLLIQPRYGLEIKKEVETSTQGKMRVGITTVYQLLHRLERRGLVESQWIPTTQGPPRNYYRLTRAGREVVHCYVTEMFLPGSPIAAAMGEITAKVIRYIQENQK